LASDGHKILLARIQSRRDDIERRLHCLQQNVPKRPDSVDDWSSSRAELKAIAESKRLAALLYLHVRLDSSRPDHPHIARITARILGLLPHISVRTNTLLWPLFIVGIMGVQNASDTDKLLVLQLFNAMQRTRQLGNIKRARRIVEEVWRQRDLRGSEAVGWHELQNIVTREEGEISLM